MVHKRVARRSAALQRFEETPDIMYNYYIRLFYERDSPPPPPGSLHSPLLNVYESKVMHRAQGSTFRVVRPGSRFGLGCDHIIFSQKRNNSMPLVIFATFRRKYPFNQAVQSQNWLNPLTGHCGRLTYPWSKKYFFKNGNVAILTSFIIQNILT